MNNRTKQNTYRNDLKQGAKSLPIARTATLNQQEMDDRLHEALVMSFDCGDPIALQIA